MRNETQRLFRQTGFSKNSKFSRFPCSNIWKAGNEAGYAYVMVLAAVVILAILAETAAILTSYQVKKDREEELLFRGYAYQQAIQSYYLSSPGGVPSFPQNLEDLILDPRFPGLKRHLKALYPDPMGKEWNLVRVPGGGIAGVASPSQEKPIKQANFPIALASFEGAQHYSDWVFLYQPNVPVSKVPVKPPASP